MEQSQKVDKKQEETEKEILDKLEKAIFGTNNLDNMILALSIPSSKSKNQQTKIKCLQKFHDALSGFTPDRLTEEVFQKLDVKQLQNFFDHMNYSFELLGKGVKLTTPRPSYNSANLLKAFNKYVEFRGTPGILQGISIKRTLTTQVVTIKQ